jgi:hypothetical protein
MKAVIRTAQFWPFFILFGAVWTKSDNMSSKNLRTNPLRIRNMIAPVELTFRLTRDKPRPKRWPFATAAMVILNGLLVPISLGFIWNLRVALRLTISTSLLTQPV